METDFSKYNFAKYKSLEEIPDEEMDAFLNDCNHFMKHEFGAWLNEDAK